MAALLELSRAFAAPARTVRFVAFVNEEPPFCFTEHMGSAVYSQAARARGERIALMVSLEMLGYYAQRRGLPEYIRCLRRPDGFTCPRCGVLGELWTMSDWLLRCRSCHERTAGTIYVGTRKPLRMWFLAMWLVTSQKNGVSVLGCKSASNGDPGAGLA